MRIGLLGAGPWAELAHAPALEAHPDVEFTGVWARRPEAAAALAARHGVRAYDDADALIADSEAVAVALPPAVQAGFAVRAAEAGRHLLLDKPIALTVADARAVTASAERAGVASVVFFTTRFDKAAGDWIDRQAALGGWFTGRAEWIGSVFTTDNPFAASPWRREKGALWDVGPHALSVLLPVLGDVDPADPAAVSAVRGPADTVYLTLRHSGGASSALTLSLTAPDPAAGNAVEVRGTHGRRLMPEPADGPTASLGRAIDGLIESARSGVPHPCDAAFAARVTAVLAAAEERLGTDG